MTSPAPHGTAISRLFASGTGARSVLLPFIAAVVVIIAIDAGAYMGTRVLGGDATDILYPWYVTALETFWANPAGLFDPYTLGGMPSFNFVANYDPIYAIPLLFGAIPDLGQYQLLALFHAVLIPASLLAIGALRKLPARAMWVLAALSVVAVYLGPNFKYAADTDGSDCYAWTFAALAAFEYYRVRGGLRYAIALALCIDFACMRFATGAVFLPIVFVPLFAYHWREIFLRPRARRDLAVAAAVGIVVLLPNLIMQYKLYTIIQAAQNVQVVQEANPPDVFALLGMRMQDAAFYPLHTMFALPGAISVILILALGALPPRFRVLCIVVLGVLLLVSLGNVTPFDDLFRVLYRPAALFRRPYAALEVALPFTFYLLAAYGAVEPVFTRSARLLILGVTCIAAIGAAVTYPPAWPVDLLLAASTAALVLVPWNAQLFAGVLAVQWVLLIGYPTVESVFYPQPRNAAQEHFRSFRALNAFLPPVGARSAQAFRVVGIGVPAELGMYSGVYQFYSLAPSRGTRVPRRLALRSGITDSDVPTIGAFFAAHPELIGSAGLRAMAVRYYFIHPDLYLMIGPGALRAHPELRTIEGGGYWKVIEDPAARPFIASYRKGSDVPLGLDGALDWNGATFTVPVDGDTAELAFLYDSWWTARTAGGTPLPVSSDNGQLQIDTTAARGGRVVASYGSAVFTASVWLVLATYAALAGYVVVVRRRRILPVLATLRRRYAGSAVSRRDGLAFRLAVNALVAVAAYLLSLQFIFPHFIAPFAPYHADMYLPPDMVALGQGFSRVLFAPRPLLWATLLVVGHFGLEGSALALTAITLVDLVLAYTILERFVLRRPAPLYVTLGTFLFAIAGPEFYFVAGYDVGSSTAMFFGLLGVLCWESGARDARALFLTGLCFALSTLTKEGFVPALVIYALYAAFREQLPRRTRITLVALPFAAALVAFVDGQLTHTPFVNLQAGERNPYAISFAPGDVFESVRFYLGPLVNLVSGLAFAVLALGAWARGRGRLALGIAVTGLTLWVPYLVLPNHRLEYYQWSGMPLLMLLVPLAWSPGADEASGPLERSAAQLRAITAVLVPVCLAAILWDRSQDVRSGSWSLQQQDVNRSLLAGIGSVGTEVARSRAVLVCGLSYPFDPWEHAEFLTRELGFNGEWTVAIEPSLPAIPVQRHARPIAYSQIRLTDYDLVVVFGANGQLEGAYRPEQLEALAAQNGLARASVYDIVSALRTGRIAKPDLPRHNGA